MPVDVVVGLQFGSEGKGRLIERIADKYSIMVRTGAPNAGHKVWNINGDFESNPIQYPHQIIPCGVWSNPRVMAVLGAGAMIDPDQLYKELAWFDKERLPFNPQTQLLIDRNAVVIEQRHIAVEQPMHQAIGSTAHGCGAALINKIARDGSIRMAKDIPELSQYICDTVTYLNGFLKTGAWILLEGTQGSMLSLTTSPYYPYCTSRDTNVSNWLSEAGISPFWLQDVYGVFRTYPIRVAGNSGPTGASELTWDDIRSRSGNPNIQNEKTTVTKKTRRIFEFSKDDFERACMINTPTKLCMNFVDYIGVENNGLSTELGAHIENLSDKTKQWLSDTLSPEIRDILLYIGTGPSYYDMIVEAM